MRGCPIWGGISFWWWEVKENHRIEGTLHHHPPHSPCPHYGKPCAICICICIQQMPTEMLRQIAKLLISVFKILQSFTSKFVSQFFKKNISLFSIVTSLWDYKWCICRGFSYGRLPFQMPFNAAGVWGMLLATPAGPGQCLDNDNKDPISNTSFAHWIYHSCAPLIRAVLP